MQKRKTVKKLPKNVDSTNVDREAWYARKREEWKQRAIKLGIEGKGWISL